MTKVVSLEAWKGKIQQGPRGAKKNMHNLMLYMQHLTSLGKSLCFNEMSERIEWQGEPIEDHHVVDIRLTLENSGAEFHTQDVWPAINRHARDNSYNPILVYLSKLKWDGTERLDTWLQDYMGCKDQETLRIFGAKFLIGAVARVKRPGCQMDNALVLEGAQGAGKTTAVSTLFGLEFMTSSITDFKSKEAAIGLQSSWCVEIAELSAMKRTGLQEVKRFITERVDKYRPAYGKIVVDRPRRCVFIATTNERNYLEDMTGNRRFWPVPCGEVDVGRIEADRDQLWAEAVHRYEADEAWWIEDKEIIKQVEAAQSDRAIEDPWLTPIDAWLDENLGVEFVTASRLLTDAVKVPIDRQTRADQNRIGNIMQQKGWANERKIPAFGAKRVRGYTRP